MRQKLEERIEQLRALERQVLANWNHVIGQLNEAEYWLQELSKGEGQDDGETDDSEE